MNKVQQMIQKLRKAGYIADERIATAVLLVEELEKPLIVEGPPGAGKTELGKAIARMKNAEFIRLQCYEGLDVNHAIYEWEYSKQMLYVQMLRSKLDEMLQKAKSLNDAIKLLEKDAVSFFSEEFLIKRPLLKAITGDKLAVLLIDEIDRADEEFEAFLLELLSDWQITIPEIGTIKAQRKPLVVITSNAVRELSEALRRRALHLFIDFPDTERELEILKFHVPDAEESLAQQVVNFVAKIRKLALRKPPSPSESIDWLRALVKLNVKELSDPIISQTISTLIKHPQDIRTLEKEGLVH